jgi:hypothetical protein
MSNHTDAAKEFAPLRNETRLEVLRKRYDDIRALAGRASMLVADIADAYTKDLDEFVERVNEFLEGSRETSREIADSALRRMVLKLPILLYRAAEILDKAAIESSVAKAANTHVYSTYYLDTDGTIPEKEAFAKLKAVEVGLIVDLARHVYNRVKGKIDAAIHLQDGVKKVMTSKDTDKNTFRRDPN